MPEVARRQTWLEWGASWLGMGGEGGDSDEAAAFKSAQHLEMGVPAAEILQAASGPQAVVKASAQRKVPYRMFWGNVEVSLPDDWSNPADCAPMAEHVEMRTAPPNSWGNIDLAIHLEIRDAEGEAHETLREFFEEMVKSDDIDDYGEIGTRPIDEDRTNPVETQAAVDRPIVAMARSSHVKAVAAAASLVVVEAAAAAVAPAARHARSLIKHRKDARSRGARRTSRPARSAARSDPQGRTQTFSPPAARR